MANFLQTKNRAVSTLDSGIASDDLSLTVATGEGAKFPSTYPFHITIDAEILECTNRVDDVLTVTRAAEGTDAAAHDSAATVSLNITAQVITELQEAKAVAGWTVDKLIKGAGVGEVPTEIAIGTTAGTIAAGDHTHTQTVTLLGSADDILVGTSWTDIVSVAVPANVKKLILLVCAIPDELGGKVSGRGEYNGAEKFDEEWLAAGWVICRLGKWAGDGLGSEANAKVQAKADVGHTGYCSGAIYGITI